MKILERLRKTNSLRVRVLVPLILALMLLLGSMALILQQSQQKVLGQELAAKTMETERLFLEYRNEEAQKLSLALSTLTLNKELMAAFKSRDRERLHDMTSSYFERLRSHYDVTHLYFSGPDRVNILRVHQPDRYGDRIDRFTTLEAEKTGKESWGFELGPLGTFTLRAVTPWHDGEKLLGYVELGMEIEHILEELRKILDSRVYVFIDKELIQREGWEAGIRMLGHKEEWGHFPDTVITGEPLDQIPENVAQVMAGEQPLQPGTDIHSNGTYYQVAFIPLIDAGKREIGHISILLDTTARVSAFHRSVLFISIFYVLVGTALVMFFYALLGQIEKKQKRLEESRLEFEQKFRIIFDNANDGIMLADIETKKFSLGNKMMCSMLGYGPEEIKTLGFADIHPAKDLPRVIDHFERMQKGDFSIVENLPVKRKDGTVFYADISARPVTLGGKSYLVGIFRDITEWTKAEERIRESEARYRSIFEYADDMICLLNTDGTYRALNPAFERITGWKPEEWIGKPFAPIVHPDDLPYARDIFRKLMAGESSPSFGMRLARKSGEYFDADLCMTPLCSGSDGVTGALGIARDVTERNRAEEAITIANEFSKTVMDSIDDAISIIDVSDYRIIGCNAVFLKQVGLAEADVVGRKCYEVIHNQPDPCGPFDICPMKETVTTGKHSTAEHIHSLANGYKFYTEVSTSPVFDRNGKVVSVVHVSRDITERKRAEEKIRSLNEELETKVQERTQQLLAAQEELVRKEKLALLGQIVGSVGHELRNPLAAMNNAVYFLQTVLVDADETTREYLNIIKDEIVDADRIVSDLLDSVRTKPPQPEAVGVREVIEQTLGKLTIPPSVSVKLDIPETLPDLRVDPKQIHQVFRNLISNGMEAMPEGGMLAISAVENRQDSTVAVSVRDSGSGITPEALAKLFHPLFTTKARGIGLGLVVCKNLAEANGGRIEVESKLDKGTTFMVMLPVERKV